MGPSGVDAKWNRTGGLATSVNFWSRWNRGNQAKDFVGRPLEYDSWR